MRDDARARAVARFLVGPQIWTDRPLPGAGPKVHGPGWRAAPDLPDRHMVFEAEVADGLAHAYLARDALGLDADTVARIREEISRVATGPDWRWPALRLNQFNWYVSIFAADAAVNGADRELADGLRRHLDRFVAGVRPRGDSAGNLGPGLRFHYLPERSPATAKNVDSAEYANIVLGFARHYAQARRAGMPAPAGLPLLHDWIRRAVAGYWTHGGSLNWDTGLGFLRWQQRKKVALSQLSLIGIASAPELQPSPEWGAWAKWLLDRGLEAYDSMTARLGTIPGPLAYGVHAVAQSRDNAFLAAARYEANAMRALENGLAHAPATEPPALYAYDPDTGRLAVTTPAYNTAIVAVNQHAFPYGGLDLARLLDSRQEVAATIGGRAPAAFGLTVSDRAGRSLLRTQYGARSWRRGVVPLRLVHAPSGVGATASAVRRAYAGPFSHLEVRGAVRGHGLQATAAYRFAPGWIDGRWAVGGPLPSGARASVTFPSWGRQARVVATLRDGRRVRVTNRARALSGVRELHVISEHSGYRLIPRGGAGTIRLVATAPQASAPDPGPTLTVTLAGKSFAARLVVG